jgi:hypothetical protein
MDLNTQQILAVAAVVLFTAVLTLIILYSGRKK